MSEVSPGINQPSIEPPKLLEPTHHDPSAERPIGNVRVQVSQSDLIYAVARQPTKATEPYQLSRTMINDPLFLRESTELSHQIPRIGSVYTRDCYSYDTRLLLHPGSEINNRTRGYYSTERVANLGKLLGQQGVDCQIDALTNGNQRLKIYAPGGKYGMEVILGWPSREAYLKYERDLNTSIAANEVRRGTPMSQEDVSRYEQRAVIEANFNKRVSIVLASRTRLDNYYGGSVELDFPTYQEFLQQTEFYRKNAERVLRALYSEAKVIPDLVVTLRPPNVSEDKLTEMQSTQEADPLPRTPEQVVSEKLTLDDVKGQDSAVLECRRLVRAINEPEKYEQRGVKPPKGVLLVGPPGTGKTMIAKAVSSEANADFIQINAANVGSKWINESAQKVNEVFDDAARRVKEGRKVILFVDEIDAIARTRGANSHPEDEKAISIFLQRLDGMVESKGVTLLATTNRPEIIDPAIMRPGRIDRIIEVPLPNREGRRDILQSKAKAAVNKAQDGYKNLFAEDTDWELVANITDGFSGAELENLLNKALDEKLDNDKWQPVSFEDLQRLRSSVSREYAQRQAIKENKEPPGFRFTASK